MNPNDMSRHLKTRQLMESACFLASDSAAVYVNTVKPSLRTLFAFGKFGRLHNLMYDVDFIALYGGQYGIYPSCTLQGKSTIPFATSSGWGLSDDDFRLNQSSQVFFYPEDHRIVFKELGMYAQNQYLGILPGFSAQMQADTLRLTADFPADSTDRFFHLPWYPIYDRFVEDGEEKYIEYYRDGFVESSGMEGFCRFVSGDNLILKDSLSRQTSLQIKVIGGKIRLKSRTLPEMNNSLFLSTDVYADAEHLEVEITLLPQRRAMDGNYYYRCGEDVELTDRNTGETFHFQAADRRGEHVFSIGSGKDMVHFPYCAVPEQDYFLDKAADACLSVLWPDGKMKGIPSYAYDPTTLIPQKRSDLVYCSHAGRIFPGVAAAAVRNRDISYADRGLASLEALFAVSYHGEDGSIYTPLSLDVNGSVGDRQGSSRPSDSGIIVRALVYLANAYLELGNTEKAETCVRYAWANVMTIRKMQSEDGEFYERFTYPDAKPVLDNGFHKGTVNNWTLQLWNLLPLLKKFGMDYECAETQRIVTTYIDSQLRKTPSILQMAGGGEDCAEFGDALNTAATLFTIKHLQTGEEIYKKYAEDALLKAWALSFHYSDMPGFHCMYGNALIGLFYDQPIGGAVIGGMHDLTSVEANLFAYQALGLEFGLECATNEFKARMGLFMLDNGGMYLVIQRSPNYAWKDPRRSESLSYGAIGVYAMALAQKEITLL